MAASLRQGHVLTFFFLPASTGGQDSEQRHFSLAQSGSGACGYSVYDGNNRQQKAESKRNSSSVESGVASPRQFRSVSVPCLATLPAQTLLITAVTVAQALHMHSSVSTSTSKICWKSVSLGSESEGSGSTCGSPLYIQPTI